MPDQETLFTPAEMAYWDYLPDKVSEKFCKEYRELQALEREVAAFLRNTNQKKRRHDLAGTTLENPVRPAPALRETVAQRVVSEPELPIPAGPV